MSNTADDYFQEQLRLLKGAGWIAHADEFAACVSALRKIHIWAQGEGEGDGDLSAYNVQSVTSAALAPYFEKNSKGACATQKKAV